MDLTESDDDSDSSSIVKKNVIASTPKPAKLKAIKDEHPEYLFYVDARDKEINGMYLPLSQHLSHLTFCPYPSSPTGRPQIICTGWRQVTHLCAPDTSPKQTRQ